MGIERANKRLKAFDKSMKNAAPSARKLSMLQKGLTNSFIKGNLAARGISIAYNSLRRAMAFGVVGAISYEFAMAKVAAISGATSDEVTALDRAVSDLAVVSPRTATEVANTALAMSKLGLEAKDVMASLDGVIGLSIALDENVEEVGKALVNVKNVFKKEAHELLQISDQLFTGFANSALSLEKFSTAFSFAGGTAELAGVEFEELVGVMGTLENAGIRSSTIGTQLRAVFLELDNASSKAGRAIGGQTIKSLGLVEALNRLKDAELGSLEIRKLFGKRAVSVVAALLNNVDAVDQLTRKVEESEGANKRAAKALKGTMFNALKELSSAWLELFKNMHKVIGPAGMKLINNIAEGIRNVAKSGESSSQTRSLLSELNKTVGGNITGIQAKKLKEVVEALNELRSAMGLHFTARKQLFERSFASRATETTLIISKEAKKFEENVKSANENVRKLLGNVGDLTSIKAVTEAIDAYDELINKYRQTTNAANAQEKAVKRLNAQRENAIILLNDNLKLATEASIVMDKQSLKNITGVTVDPNTGALQRFTGPQQAGLLKNLQKDIVDTMSFIEEGSEAWDDYRKILLGVSLAIEGLSMKELNEELLLAEFFGKQLAQTMDTTLSAAFSDLFHIISGNKGALVDWGNIFKSVLINVTAQLTGLIAKMLIFNALSGVAGFGVGTFGGKLLSAFTGQKLARGFDGVVSQPTLFMAGESGNERVNVTPSAKTSRTGGEGVTLVQNFNGDVFGKEKFMEAVNEANQMIGRNYV
jgi:TP901 family phage tail tape measure protein